MVYNVDYNYYGSGGDNDDEVEATYPLHNKYSSNPKRKRQIHYVNYNNYGAQAGGKRDENDHEVAYLDYKNYGSLASNKEDETQYVPYTQRWIVLAALSILSCVNNWIWIMWSPLMPNVANFWDVPHSYVDDLSAAFMYVPLPFCLPVIWFLHRYKLRTGLIVSAALNFVGALIRFWNFESYEWIYCGTLLCALCQTMALALPPRVSTYWFQGSERALATSIAAFSYQVGSTLGLSATIVTNFADGNSIDGDKLETYLNLQMILSGLVLLLILIFIRSDRPPTPPSEAATIEEDPSYIDSIKKLFGSKSGVFFFVVYGMGIGVFYSMKTFLAQFLVYDPDTGTGHGWTEEEVGYLGLTLNVIGQIASLASGKYLDRTKQYRGMALSQVTVSATSMLCFILVLQHEHVNRVLTYGVLGLFSFSLVGFFPLGFEYATALAYPADDAIVAGLMNAATQFGSWVLIVVGSHVGPIGSGKFAAILFAVLVCADILIWAFVRGKSRRPGEQEEQKSSRTSFNLR